MSRITQTLSALDAAGRKALIPFVTAGDPDLSVDKDQPVKTYIKNVAETRKAVRDLTASEPSGAE